MRELIKDDASASHLYGFLLKCDAALLRLRCQSSCKIKVQHRGHCSPPRGRAAAVPVASGAVSSEGLAFS